MNEIASQSSIKLAVEPERLSLDLGKERLSGSNQRISFSEALKTSMSALRDFSEIKNPDIITSGNVEIMPRVKIPSHQEIETKPINELRASFADAFKEICAYIKPIENWISPIAFHGTSQDGADAFLRGELPHDQRLWVGRLDSFPITTELLTRDLLNCVQVAAGFSGEGSGQSNGSLLIIKDQSPSLTISTPVSGVFSDNGYLRLYLDRHNPRGALAVREDIGKLFIDKDSLKNAIIAVVPWDKTPYPDLNPSCPGETDERRQILKEARAFFVVAKMLDNFENSPIHAEQPVDRLQIEHHSRHFKEIADGILFNPHNCVLIDRDRIYQLPREKIEVGKFIGNNFDNLTKLAFDVLRSAFPEQIPAKVIFDIVTGWEKFPENKIADIKDLIDKFKKQWSSHASKTTARSSTSFELFDE